MTTFLNIPPEGGGAGSAFWESAVADFASLPAGTVVGEVRMTLDDHNLYYWDGDSWEPVPTGSIDPSDIDDTDSVDLTITTGVLTADVNISTDAADVNYIVGELDIQSGASPGLRSQIANSLIRGLLSSGDAYIDYNNSTGVFTLSVADVLALLSSTTSAITYNDTTGEFTFVPGNVDHGGLADLTADDHPQYALLAGRGTGQTLVGGTAASNALTLSSTSNGTKGNIVLQDPLQLPVRTTVERGALTPSAGLVVFDSDLERPMIYIAGSTNAWVDFLGWGSP